MKRRTILKGLVAGTAATVTGFRIPLVQASDYNGKLFVFVQADGGWDPTSFCDPKTNTPGERVINHWAEENEIQQAGNIPYAPFANNEAFFEKYHDRMLVINGVDAQTNSHTVGVVHNWSGRNSEGYPSASAVLAAHYGNELPISYLSFGGFSDTGGLVRYTRLNNPDLLRNIARPWRSRDGSDRRYLADHEWHALSERQAADIEQLVAVENRLEAELRNRMFYGSAMASVDALADYADAIPSRSELEPRERSGVIAGSGNEYRSDLRRQVQLTVLAFKSGVSVSADLRLGGFDTHASHDPDHEWLLGNLTDSVDYLWDYAEEHGVADRLVVVMGSDFGRTNFYNAQEGKDHWPIGSFVVMEKNQSWADRAVGVTDELHFAQKVNPETLEQDDEHGTIIYPKHVHKALRNYLGVGETEGSQRYPFNGTEDFAFFASASTD
ncbi:MAG: DUF1501 domain-containing protein [Gammaproteobacteria bacterium]|nr:DUF1501 domain-containing protein [Gammaproteobacteria bacterium]